MKKSTWKKAVSLLLASTMVVGSAAAVTGCGGSKKNETITLDVFSQVANYSGLQTGWMGDILKKKFNVKFNIIPDQQGMLQTRMEEGNLGDIVIFGHNDTDYQNAVKNGLLYDWEEDDLVKEYAPNVYKNMKDAMEKNRGITKVATNNKESKVYGIGNDIALSNEDHQSFFYTWDVRWDLYKQLGYPTVKSLDDFKKLMLDMRKICPKDDNGNDTYAVSLWPDWDVDYVMYVKATATAWYGYDELGIGLYDPATGNYHDALEENGPYLEMLKFFNELFQEDLVDPDSMTQTYDKAVEKVQNGGVFWSIFNYSGQLAYNKPVHTKAGKMMYSMKPEDASPIVYGMNTQGGDYVTCIGASSEYPEKCMEVINWFASPEGKMTYAYGPKGLCWDYDKEGNTYFTDLGKECKKNINTKMGNGYKGSFKDGQCQAAISTWANDVENPDSNGETYNSDNWKSNITKAETEIEQDWRDKTGCNTANEYFEKSGKYTVSPGTSFAMEQKDDDLKTTWSQVTQEIKAGSWKAMFSKTDKEFEKNVSSMISKTKKYGYDKCLEWSKKQAERRYQLEQEATKNSKKK
ncbi:MAG: hypothetical protein HFH62_06215 [Lachnospiraceae bacterium]|nr:hypothetical protein [Lachnospiraceae bacterium]